MNRLNKLLIFVFLSLIMILSTVMGSADELPYFEDFENGLGNWTQVTAGVIQSSDRAASGTYSMKLYDTGAGHPTANNNQFNKSGSRQISFMANFVGVTTSERRFMYARDTSGDYFFYAGVRTKDVFHSNFGATFCNDCIESNTWYNFTFITNISSKTYEFILNGTSYGSTSFHSGTDFDGIASFEFLNSDSDPTSYIDDFYINGTTPSPDANFTIITLKDDYDNSNLVNFTAYIGNDVFNDSGTGTIITNITNGNSSLFNITIEKENYFNSTYNNYNVSANLNAIIQGSNITFRIVFNNTNQTANVSNTTLLDLNNSLQFISNTGFFNVNPTPLENIFFNISCNRSVFETRTFNQTILARDTNEYIVYVEPTTNKLTFLDSQNSSAIIGATINITYPVSGDEISLTTNSTGQVAFSYIKNNITEFGNYSIEFDRLGYNLITITEEITANDVPINKSYNVSRSTLNINVYNRETGNFLTGVNVTLSLLGVFEDYTTNGTYTYQNISLISQDYTLQTIADNFSTEQITFSYTNQVNLTVNIYMLNESQSNAGTLFVTVIDEYYFRQIEASVTLMEYSSTENGFITVSECLTNTNGECVFDIELNTKTYIITASKTINGNIFSATSGTAGEIIKTDEEVRRLILRTSEDFEATTIDNLLYSVTETFVNNVSSISVKFSTSDNTVTTVCVEYYIIDGFNRQSEQQDCTTSSGGIANLGTSYSLNRTNQYQAEVYNLVGTNKYVLKTFDYPSLTSAQELFDEEGLVPYLTVIIYFGLLALALYGKNLNIFYVGSIFSSWLLIGIFPQHILIEIHIAINVMCAIGIYLARKKIQEG